MLAELNARFAAGLSSRSTLVMFRHDSFSVWAVIMVVINLSVLRRGLD
jgi:hypothetical protein